MSHSHRCPSPPLCLTPTPCVLPSLVVSLGVYPALRALLTRPTFGGSPEENKSAQAAAALVDAVADSHSTVGAAASLQAASKDQASTSMLAASTAVATAAAAESLDVVAELHDAAMDTADVGAAALLEGSDDGCFIRITVILNRLIAGHYPLCPTENSTLSITSD